MGQERNKKGNKASVTTGALDQTAPGEVSVWVLCWRALLSSLALGGTSCARPKPNKPQRPQSRSHTHTTIPPPHL